MKLQIHYCRPGFTNCYLLGTDTGIPAGTGTLAADGTLNVFAPPPPGATPTGAIPGGGGDRDAIMIDPGSMEAEMLEFIESNDYRLRAVLLTHDHPGHIRGLKTLLRIYDVDIYAVNHLILERRTCHVKDGDVFSIGSFTVEAISVPGHSSDSVVYKIGQFLFTGDVLSAGLAGSTASSYGAELQMSSIRRKLLSLPGDWMVLPGHGPPSSLEAERRFNAGVQLYERNKNRRPKFTVELD